MKRFLPRSAGLCLVAAASVAFTVAGATQAAMPMPQPPLIEASAWYLVDARTGTVLTQKDAENRVPPASLTKMMTTFVADNALREGRIHPGDMVQISTKAWKQQGSRMFVQVGTQVSVEDLFRGIVIQSGNDASVALAEHIAGSEEQFAGLMNQYAQKIGMTNSHFMNATGLPDSNHYSTTHDLATLARAIIYQFPENYRFYSEKEFSYNGITQPNRNLLLFRDPTVDGLKTGHTDEAGFCLVASAKRGDTRLVSVMMGTKSENARADESAKLLNWGFNSFETYAPYPAGTTLGEAVVWMGQADKIQLGVLEDIVLTIPRGTHANLKAAITVQPNIRAPLKKGDRLGSLVIRSGDEIIIEKPLLAMSNIEEGSIFKRGWHWLKLMFAGLFG